MFCKKYEVVYKDHGNLYSVYNRDIRMGAVAELGGEWISVPPMGKTLPGKCLTMDAAAERLCRLYYDKRDDFDTLSTN